MKKHIAIVLLLITNYSFSQENIFKKMPFFIGDKVDMKLLIEPINFKTKNFSLTSYGASDDNIIYRLNFNIYNNKAFERVESFFQSNQNMIKVSHLNWQKSFTECYIDKTNDIEYIIKYNPGYDPNFIGNISILSHKLLESKIDKIFDKANNQTIYITLRYCYLGLNIKENIYFNFRFNTEESNVYGIMNLYTDKAYELRYINFILNDGKTIKKQLTTIDKKKLDNDFIDEANFFVLTYEELKKIDQAEKVDIQIIGDKKNTNFEMTYPQKMSIRDILTSDEYKNVTIK